MANKVGRGRRTLGVLVLTGAVAIVGGAVAVSAGTGVDKTHKPDPLASLPTDQRDAGYRAILNQSDAHRADWIAHFAASGSDLRTLQQVTRNDHTVPGAPDLSSAVQNADAAVD